MDTPLVTAVARVPIVVRFLDARGHPVSLSGRTLGRASTDLQDLLRTAYTAVRGPAATETVTVSFLEEDEGRLQLEYLVVDRAPRPARWWRRPCARRCAQECRAALTEATIVVTAAIEAVGALASATAARWTDSDSPDFADAVLDGTRAVRVPGTVRAWTQDEAVLELLRGTMSMFLDDDVEQLVIGKDPETPGAYQETVVARSPALLRFLQGAPLASLADPDRP